MKKMELVTETELRELVVQLALNFASQPNKALLSRITSTPVASLNPISEKQEAFASGYPKVGVPESGSLFAPPLPSLGPLGWITPKIKDRANRSRYNKGYPSLSSFSTIFEKGGMQTREVCPVSSKIHKVR